MNIFSRNPQKEDAGGYERPPWQTSDSCRRYSRTGDSASDEDIESVRLIETAPSIVPSEPANAPAGEVITSIISAGSTWQGSLTILSSVRIEGKLSGDVSAGDTVHIAQDAEVDADIHAAFVVIAGTFRGKLRCTERLELLPTSRVGGELITRLLMVHEGAILNGEVKMSIEEPRAPEIPVLDRRTNRNRGGSFKDSGDESASKVSGSDTLGNTDGEMPSVPAAGESSLDGKVSSF